MKKVLAGIVTGVALLGLAACGDTDSTTTQGVDSATPPPAAAPDPGTGTTAPDAPPPGGATP